MSEWVIYGWTAYLKLDFIFLLLKYSKICLFLFNTAVCNTNFIFAQNYSISIVQWIGEHKFVQ
jgi:hypothetical protein